MLFADAAPTTNDGCPEAADATADASAVVTLLRAGSIECAATVARGLADETKRSAENVVAMELRSVERSIKAVREALKDYSGSSAADADASRLVPAWQWAQSGRDVFVSVKFAHKLDAPATLISERDVESVDFGNTSVKLRASKGGKRYGLELALLRAIEPGNSTWQSASVGRATLTMRKAANYREWWPRLLLSKARSNVWWDKQEALDHEKEEVEKEARAREKEAKKKAKEESAATTTSSDESMTNDDAPTADAAASEASSSGNNGEASSSSADDEKADKPATTKSKQAKRESALKKAAAQRKKDADNEARDKRRAINEEATKKIGEVDAELKKQKELIDAELAADIARLSSDEDADVADAASSSDRRSRLPEMDEL